MTEPQTPISAVAETAHDSKTFKKLLMDQVRSRGGTRAIDTKQLFQSMVKDRLEAFLELEMEEHLGYARNAAEGRGSGTRVMARAVKPYAAISGKWKSKRRAIATLAWSRKSRPNARPASATSARR